MQQKETPLRLNRRWNQGHPNPILSLLSQNGMSEEGFWANTVRTLRHVVRIRIGRPLSSLAPSRRIDIPACISSYVVVRWNKGAEGTSDEGEWAWERKGPTFSACGTTTYTHPPCRETRPNPPPTSFLFPISFLLSSSSSAHFSISRDAR